MGEKETLTVSFSRMIHSPAMFTVAGGSSNIRLLPHAGSGDMNDQQGMRLALAEAERARAAGEVPIGAVIVHRGEVVGRGHNGREGDADPLAHAELRAIGEAAAASGDWRLSGSTMYVTLEPCAMCAGALVNSRIDRLVFGARDPKAGFCGSLGDIVRDPRLNHRLEVEEGVLAEECGRLLTEFFEALRTRDRNRRGERR